MASIFGHIFDWILEHVIYPIMTLGKVDRDWDNNDFWNHQSPSWGVIEGVQFDVPKMVE